MTTTQDTTAVMRQALEALETCDWVPSGHKATEARNALRAALATNGWQPIETAPRDGSDVLLFEVYERLPAIGWWCEKKGRWYANTEVYDVDGNACIIDKLYNDGITHWMPLPSAPVQEGDE